MAYTTGTAATAAAAHLNRTYEGPYLIRSCPAGHLSYLRCIRRTRWQGDIFTTICQTNVKKARDTYCWSWYYRTGRGRTAMLLRRRSVLVTEQQRFRHRCVPTAFSPPPRPFLLVPPVQSAFTPSPCPVHWLAEITSWAWKRPQLKRTMHDLRCFFQSVGRKQERWGNKGTKRECLHL